MKTISFLNKWLLIWLLMLGFTQSQAVGMEGLPTGEFSMINHRGEAVTEATYNGSYRLVFFGFTQCPLICPTTMTDIVMTLKLLGDQAELIQPLFITVDPDRDTVEVLSPYVAAFHPRMVGLTGTEEQVAKTAKAFNVVYGYQREDESSAVYDVYHSASVVMASGVAVKGGCVLASLPAVDSSAAVFTIENEGGRMETVIAAETDVADKVEFHSMELNDGVMYMNRFERLDIPRGSERKLSFKGDHLMLIGLDKPLKEGDRVNLTLRLASENSIAVELPVVSRADIDQCSEDNSEEHSHDHDHDHDHDHGNGHHHH